MFWEDISLEKYEAWMQDLQSELEDYELIEDDEGIYQMECEIEALANAYAEQIKKESNSG